MKIYKFSLAIAVTQDVRLSRGATILSVQFQNDILTMWALVDPKAPHKYVTIEIHPTGGPDFDPHILGYLATVQDSIGCVWHVWRKLQSNPRAGR